MGITGSRWAGGALCRGAQLLLCPLPSRKLLLTVDTTDENFMPKRIAVYGGEGDSLKKLSDVGIDE